MQTRSRWFAPRRTVAAAAVLVAAPLVASCGFDVQTDQVYQPAEGSNDRAEGADVLGAVVVSDTDGTGRLIATFVDKRNTGDEVTGISGEGLKVTGPSSIKIPSNAVGFANLADEQFEPVVVRGSKVEPGGYVTLRFSFADTGSTSLAVPVVDTSGSYAGLAPGQERSGEGTGASNDVAARGSQGALTSNGGGS